jgi:hypothetical protein
VIRGVCNAAGVRRGDRRRSVKTTDEQSAVARAVLIGTYAASDADSIARHVPDHTGMTSGLFFGNFAMVASLTFRCWATIAGGVRDIQSDSETSAK